MCLCEKRGLMEEEREREREREGLMLSALTERVSIEDDTSTLVNL